MEYFGQALGLRSGKNKIVGNGKVQEEATRCEGNVIKTKDGTRDGSVTKRPDESTYGPEND